MNTPNRAQFIPASLTPTAEQRDIQLSQHKVSLVHANAGAAKTTTLALRVGEALARGVVPEQILALTFTAEAKQVMKARLQDVGIAYNTVSRVHVLTLDEFAEQVLAGIEDGTPLQLQTARDLKLPALDALESVSSGYAHKADLLEIRTHDTAVSQFLDAMLRLKARMVLDQDDTDMALEYVAEDLGVSLTDYVWAREYETLRLGGFEDLQFRGPFDATYDLARLLRDHPETRAVLPVYRLVVGDELHDLNEASFTVLQALLDCDGLYFVGAGDRDQVIHSQLGADEKYLDHRFGERFPGNARYPLTTTFRHGPHLAYAIEAFKRKPVRSSLPTATQLVESWYDDTPGGCADRVVEALKQWKTQKHPLDGCAILLRDRHQSAEIENALMQANIGYRTQTTPSYLRREEILFLRGMVAIALGNLHMVKAESIRAEIVESLAIFGEVPMAPKALEQARTEIAKHPEMLRHFFEGQIQRVGAEAARTRISDAVAYVQGLAPDTPAHMALREICGRIGMQALAKRLYVHPYDASVIAKSVDGFIAMAQTSEKSLRDFSDWIGAADEFVASRKSKNLVLIECVAHAKGKEFDHVILPFLEAGEFPNPLKESREEENLFYVAATRAKTRLTLIAPTAQDKRSPFIARMAITSTRSRADAAVRTNASQQQPAITRQDLKVSYADKDVVKAMGAQWDATRKVWYVREGLDVEPFRAWIPKT
jgi:DNA helicase-2/ATP-dependent DNA helicase PcrA